MSLHRHVEKDQDIQTSACSGCGQRRNRCERSQPGQVRGYIDAEREVRTPSAVVLPPPIEKALERKLRLRVIGAGNGSHLVAEETGRPVWVNGRSENNFDTRRLCGCEADSESE